MTITRFEDILVWRKARESTKTIYIFTRSLKDFDFRSQIRRASISISNNIAEGFERKSNNEFKHFLFIAKGSAGEVRSMLYSALDLGYINKKDHDSLLRVMEEISRMLSGFIQKL